MQPAPTTTRKERAGVPPSEVTVLSKVFLRNGAGLTKDQARYLVGLAFSAEDKARMSELARKNGRGQSPPKNWGSWTAT